MLPGTAGSDSPGAGDVSQGSRGGVQLPHALGLLHRPAKCQVYTYTYICACVYSSVCVSVYKHLNWVLPFLILTLDSRRPQNRLGTSRRHRLCQVRCLRRQKPRWLMQRKDMLCLLSGFTAG